MPSTHIPEPEAAMSWPLRHVPEGGALVEVTLNCIQGRYLLRPDPKGEVNELVLGVVGRAQRLYEMPIVGISAMSSHLLCAAAHNRCYVERPVMWSRRTRFNEFGDFSGGYCT